MYTVSRDPGRLARFDGDSATVQIAVPVTAECSRGCRFSRQVCNDVELNAADADVHAWAAEHANGNHVAAA
jgi:hypothetical protein